MADPQVPGLPAGVTLDPPKATGGPAVPGLPPGVALDRPTSSGSGGSWDAPPPAAHTISGPASWQDEYDPKNKARLQPIFAAIPGGQLLLSALPASKAWELAYRFSHALPTVGGMAASVAGGSKAMPTGAALAGVGGAGGEAANQLLTSYLSRGEEGPQSSSDAASSILKEGATQAGMEAGGRLFQKVLGAMAAGPMRAKPSDAVAKTVQQVNKDAGLRMTPAELTDSFPGRAVQFFGDASLGGRPIAQEARQEGQANATKFINDSLSRITPTAPGNQTTGKAVQSAIQDVSSPLYKAEGQRVASQLDAATKGVMVDMKPLKAAAKQEFLQAALPPSGVSATFPEVGGISAGRNKILADIMNSPDSVPFQTAREFRTKLAGVGPQQTELLSNEAQAAAKNYKAKLTDALDSAVSQNPTAQQAWQGFRQYFKEGGQTFDSDLVSKVLNTDPEKVAAMIGNGDLTKAQTLRKAVLGYTERLGNPQQAQEAQATWAKFQDAFARTKLLNDPERVGQFDLAGMSQRLKDIGPDTLSEIYGHDPAGRQFLGNARAVGMAFDRIHGLPGTKWAFIAPAFQIAQHMLAATGLVGGALSGNLGSGMAGAATVEGLPILIASVLRNPEATHYLTEGIRGWGEASRFAAVRGVGAAGTAIGNTIDSPAGQAAARNIFRAFQLATAKEPAREPNGSPATR